MLRKRDRVRALLPLSICLPITVQPRMDLVAGAGMPSGWTDAKHQHKLKELRWTLGGPCWRLANNVYHHTNLSGDNPTSNVSDNDKRRLRPSRTTTTTIWTATMNNVEAATSIDCLTDGTREYECRFGKSSHFLFWTSN